MQEAKGKRTLAEIDWENWKPVERATLVFCLRGDEILLIRKKRGLGAGKINGPGGRLEKGESWEDCARRETLEEVGITVHGLEFSGENWFQFVDGYSIHVHAFVSRDFSGTAIETDEAKPMWTAVDQIPYEEMWEDDRLWLPLALEGKPFVARYIFDGDDMLDHSLEAGSPHDD